MSGSPLTLAALSASPQAPLDAAQARATVQFALKNVDATLRSQLGTQKTLENALKVLTAEDPTSTEAIALKTLVADRAKLLRDVAKNQVAGAEQAQQRAGNAPAAQNETLTAVVAAQQVHQAVNPKSSTLKTLRQKEETLLKATQRPRPFFARFLENQHRSAPSADAALASAAVQPEAAPSGPKIVHAGVVLDRKDGTPMMMRGGVPYEVIAETPEAKAGLAARSSTTASAVEVTGRLGRLEDPNGGPPRAVVFATNVKPVQSPVELNGMAVIEEGRYVLKAAGRRFEIATDDAAVQKQLAKIDAGGLQVTLTGTPVEVAGKTGTTLTFDVAAMAVKGPGTLVVTMKFPSDNEDSGADGESVTVTMKAPSDHEDSGDGNATPPLTTAKFPSDAEDNAGNDPGVYVTLKAPSDHEDGGDTGSNPPGPDIFVTMKAPSDHEDGGDGWIGVEPTPRAGDGDGAPADGGGVGDGDSAGPATRKYPSDNEDGGTDEVGTDGGISYTRKYPSDNEDGGANDPGGMMVTMKAPSDNEDGGTQDETGGMVVTMKFPSDNEDGGDGGPGLSSVTERFPSDSEDVGEGVDVGTMVTMKFPSDNEDGGAGGPASVTEKYPSDAEDQGELDPGQVTTTAKFPSDNEDQGTGGDMMVTMKFPSDNEDGASVEASGPPTAKRSDES